MPTEEEVIENILSDNPNLEEVTESEVGDWPGWVRVDIKNPNGTTNRKYRSPGGIEVSNNRWSVLKHKFRGQKFIPEEMIVDKKPAPVFFTRPSTYSPTKGPSEPYTRPKQATNTRVHQEPVTEGPLDIPEAKPRPGKAQQGKATSKELSDSFITTLLIATSLVALVLQFPDLAMQEVEAKSIAIPLANILERTTINERFGKLIASSGDYQMLGYGLFLYLERVTGAVQSRRQQRAQQPRSAQQAPAAAAPEPVIGGVDGNAPIGQAGLSSNIGAGLVGANLPYSAKSTGRVTPITRQG
jgi:hypothetical protein